LIAGCEKQIPIYFALRSTSLATTGATGPEWRRSTTRGRRILRIGHGPGGQKQLGPTTQGFGKRPFLLIGKAFEPLVQAIRDLDLRLDHVKNSAPPFWWSVDLRQSTTITSSSLES
jgi:hypothetical protein